MGRFALLGTLRRRLRTRRSEPPAPAPEAPAPAPSLGDELGQRMRPALALAGSAAAVGAFLLYAGFLSDYGAYQLAGLPRLNFSFTGSAEAGASTLIDMLALLAQGTRIGWMALGLAAVLALWAWQAHPRLQGLAGSRAMQRGAALALLATGFLLLAAQVDQAQRSLSGQMHSAAAIERALRQAYAQSVPTPLQRQTAIEREGFALRYFTAPNWGVALEEQYRRARQSLCARTSWVDCPRTGDVPREGFALRVLPESQRDARHTFGWLGLCVITLVLGQLLVAWWGRHQSQDGAATGSGGALDEALRRFVRPLAWALAVVSVALLPLSHGLLARTHLGGETVLVYLRPDSLSTEEVPGKADEARTARRLAPEPSAQAWPAGRLDCGAVRGGSGGPGTPGDLQVALQHDQLRVMYALRDLAQERPGEPDFAARRAELHVAMSALAEAVLATGCAEAIVALLQTAPPVGLSAQVPEVAELYRRTLQRVSTAFGVRTGTLLNVPRDGQSLVLVEQIVPRRGTLPPLWSVQGIRPEQIAESVVLPNLDERASALARERLNANPNDDDALTLLTVLPRRDTLAELLRLLRDGLFEATGRNYTATSLGAGSMVSQQDAPALATQAIALLAQLTTPEPSAAWPDKDERLRGTALTALHLSRHAYGAALLAQSLRAEMDADSRGCGAPGGDAHNGRTLCVQETSTAIGLLRQDLAMEAAWFAQGQEPASLREAMATLDEAMVRLLLDDTLSEDVRSAVCTALGLAGARRVSITPAQSQRFLAQLQGQGLAQRAFSASSCVGQAHKLNLPDGPLRQTLRAVLTAERLPGHAHRLDDERLRYAALNALLALGVAGEDKLAFELQLGQQLGQDEREILHTKLMPNVSALRLAPRLLACAEDSARPPAQRERCLEGLLHTKANLDGDDGSAQRVRALVEQGLVDPGCRVLASFKARGGLALWRMAGKDELTQACLRAVKEAEAAAS